MGLGRSAHIVGLALSAALLVVFVRRQGRVVNPLMPLRLFRSRNVVGANSVQALLVAGMFGMFFLGAPTCSGCSTTARSRSGSPSCRPRW